jgi:hypothetical protein
MQRGGTITIPVIKNGILYDVEVSSKGTWGRDQTHCVAKAVGLKVNHYLTFAVRRSGGKARQIQSKDMPHLLSVVNSFKTGDVLYVWGEPIA